MKPKRLTSTAPLTQSDPIPSAPAQFTVWTLVGLVVANMIGLGVFTSSGFSLAALGNPGRVMLAWSLCGVWAISGAVAYGGLASRLPMSGGEYLFLSRFVHPSVGFLAGWVSVFAGFTAPIALAAKGAALHSLPNTTSDDFEVNWMAAAVIAVAGTCHLVGFRLGASIQNAIVLIKLLLLGWIIAIAFVWAPAELWQGGALPDGPSSALPTDFGQWWILAGSMSWIALSYTGFNAAVYVAGESNDAAVKVPRSLLIGTVLVTVLYLLLNYIFVYAPAPDALVSSDGAGREDVAVIATAAIGGQRLAAVLRVTIVLSMLSSVFAMLMLGPRVYRQMSLDGVMPKFLSGTNYRLAICVQCALSVAAVFMGNILELMTYLGLTLTACGALAVGSLWWVRRQLPESRPLGWVEHIAVGLYLVISICLIAASSQQRSQQFQAMLWTFALGLCVFAFGRIFKPSHSLPV